MDWINKAKEIFKTDKPVHFNNNIHCPESAEHNETLISHDIETISIKHLGNPCWDPLCFSSGEGIKYYMPALIRISLDTMENDFYIEQLLFHLTFDNSENGIITICSEKQKKFIYDFLTHIIEKYPKELETELATDDILKALEIWKP